MRGCQARSAATHFLVEEQLKVLQLRVSRIPLYRLMPLLLYSQPIGIVGEVCWDLKIRSPRDDDESDKRSSNLVEEKHEGYTFHLT